MFFFCVLVSNFLLFLLLDSARASALGLHAIVFVSVLVLKSWDNYYPQPCPGDVVSRSRLGWARSSVLPICLSQEPAYGNTYDTPFWCAYVLGKGEFGKKQS